MKVGKKEEGEQDSKKTVVVPCVKGDSEKLRRIFKKKDIPMVFKLVEKSGEKFPLTKDKTWEFTRSYAIVGKNI